MSRFFLIFFDFFRYFDCSEAKWRNPLFAKAYSKKDLFASGECSRFARVSTTLEMTFIERQRLPFCCISSEIYFKNDPRNSFILSAGTFFLTIIPFSSMRIFCGI